MGGACCKPAEAEAEPSRGPVSFNKTFKRPKWKSEEPLTEAKLASMREEFWDTQPHYGGHREIWDALKAAVEADLPTARLIIDSAGVIVMTEDMGVCYDEQGCKYELPQYVLSEPSNLLRERRNSSSKQRPGSGGGGGQQVELPVAAAGS